MLSILTKVNSTFNSNLTKYRREIHDGVYDIHTNAMLYPRDMQPSHIRIERVPGAEDKRESERSKLVDSANKELSRLRLTADENLTATGIVPENGTGDMDISISNDDERSSSAIKTTNTALAPGSVSASATIFPPVAPRVSRHFAVHDIHYESPAYTALGPPGANASGHSSGIVTVDPNTGEPILNMDPEILRALPPDCREAYIDAAMKEWEWKRKFTPVGDNRGYEKPKMSFAYHI